MKSPPAEPVESRHLRAAHLDDHGAELSTFNESNATDLGSSTIQMHHHHGEVVFSTAMTGYVESSAVEIESLIVYF